MKNSYCADNRRIGLFTQLAMIAMALLSLTTVHAEAQTDAIQQSVEYTFENDEALAELELHATGEAAKRMPKPKSYDGQLYLLESWWKSSATALFPAPTDQLHQTIDVTFSLVMNTGTEGASFIWLPINQSEKDATALEAFEAWEAPSIANAFGVGFDASDPPNRDPFRGSGNIHERPEHEISLHWNGVEIIKALTETEFRDEEPHAVHLTMQFVVGGADITLTLDDETVFDHYFVAEMLPYAGRAMLGARNTETAGDVMFDDLSVRWDHNIEPPVRPTTFVAIDHQLNDKSNKETKGAVHFPEDSSAFGRIICTLTLDKPETRFDPWDRIAHIYVTDDAGERFELIRYITPYHRGFEWKVDVTDLRPLLQGEREIVQACTTYGEGWVVSVRFDFYPGVAEQLAYKVVPLWKGAPEIGNPDKPASDFYTQQIVQLDEDTTAAKVRMVVTGHGMSPNTDNAGEFMPLGRSLTVNDESFTNTLWKTDNYLNPCRPQGGTWKYDRAGWAPGDIARPWEVDVSHLLSKENSASPRNPLTISYALDEYINTARGETWAPTHNTNAYLVLYKAKP